MLDNGKPYGGSFQQLADARRVLKVTNTLRSAPVLTPEDRAELNRIRSIAIQVIEAASEELIETLDVLQGDVDAEVDDPPEDDGSEEQSAWLEWIDQTRSAYSQPGPAHFQNHEDAEDDDPLDSGGDEGEPDFRKRPKGQLARLYGPGCNISDPDFGSEELGEPEIA